MSDPPGITSSDFAARFAEWVIRHLDGDLPDAEEALLAAELRRSKSRRHEFVELCLHAQFLADSLAVQQAQVDSEQQGGQGACTSLDEAGDLPSVAGDSADTPVVGMVVPPPVADEPEEVGFAPPVPVRPEVNESHNASRHRRLAAIILFPLLLGIGLLWWVTHRQSDPPRTPALADHSQAPSTDPLAISPSPAITRTSYATLTAILDAQWDEPHTALRPGQPLPSEPLFLKAGLVHIKTEKGVSLIVEAPARFQIRSDTSAELTVGKLTAIVPPAAHGYAVQGPFARVIDLGTEFGMNVAPSGEVAASVFVGKIVMDAGARADTRADTRVQPEGASKSLELKAGESARSDATGVRSAPPDPVGPQYVRDIRKVRRPIPAYGTGVGAKRGEPDPHWQITAVEFDAKTPVGPAFVVSAENPNYVANDGRSQWISNAPDAPTVAKNGQYTFTTTFDLTHFVSDSTRLHLRIAVDDGVAAIRLNGNDTGIQLDPKKGWMKSLKDFDIDHGFVAGLNRIEVVVVNRASSGGPQGNPMGLQLELAGTAFQEVDTGRN